MADSKKLKEPTKASAFCKKHPKHRQSPGVCSLCLREKLSKLRSRSSRSSWKSSSTMLDSSSSLSYVSSYYSSFASSTSSSPLHGSRRLDTTTLLRGKNKLAKSRSSMPFFPRFRLKDEGDEKNSKGGIWSKLIGRRSRRTQMKESLKHSKTVRERTDDIIVAH